MDALAVIYFCSSGHFAHFICWHFVNKLQDEMGDGYVVCSFDSALRVQHVMASLRALLSISSGGLLLLPSFFYFFIFFYQPFFVLSFFFFLKILFSSLSFYINYNHPVSAEIEDCF